MAWGAVEQEPEVRDWLEALTPAEFGRVAFYIDLLEERGPQLGEPYTKQLDGKLRELRFYLDGRAIRVLRSSTQRRAKRRGEDGGAAP